MAMNPLHGRSVIKLAIYEPGQEEKKATNFGGRGILLSSTEVGEIVRTKLPKNYKIATKNAEYFVNKTILFSICVKAEEVAGETEWKLNVDDPDGKFEVLARLFNGERVRILGEEKKIFKDFQTILGVFGFPPWLVHKSDRAKTFMARNLGKVPAPKEVEMQIFMASVPVAFPVVTFVVNGTPYEIRSFVAYRSGLLRDLVSSDTKREKFDLTGVYDGPVFGDVVKYLNGARIEMNQEKAETIMAAADIFELPEMRSLAEQYVSNLSAIQESLEKEEESVESVLQLQNILLGLSTENIGVVCQSILESKWCSNRDMSLELASVIVVIGDARPKLAPALALLVKSLVDRADENPQLADFGVLIRRRTVREPGCYRGPLAYHLYQLGLLCIGDIANVARAFLTLEASPAKAGLPRFPLDNSRHRMAAFLFWFLPELEEEGLDLAPLLMKTLQEPEGPRKFSLIADQLPPAPGTEQLAAKPPSKDAHKPWEIVNFDRLIANDWSLYKELRDKKIPGNQISQAICEDNVEELQRQLIVQGRGHNAKVAVSIFGNVTEVSLLAYSALCCSEKCLKFLLMNGAQVGQLEVMAAVYGGSNEIVRQLDLMPSADSSAPEKPRPRATPRLLKLTRGGMQKSELPVFYQASVPCDDLVTVAIASLHFDIFDWLMETQITNDKDVQETMIQRLNAAISTDNLHALAALIDSGITLDVGNPEEYDKSICLAARTGFGELFHMLMKFSQKRVKTTEFERSWNILLRKTFSSGCIRALRTLDEVCCIPSAVVRQGLPQCLEASVESGNIEMFKLALRLRQQFCPSASLASCLKGAVQNGFDDIIDAIISAEQAPRLRQAFDAVCKADNIELFDKLAIQKTATDFSALLDACISSQAWKVAAHILERCDCLITFETYKSLLRLPGKIPKRILELLIQATGKADRDGFLVLLLKEAVKQTKIQLVESLAPLCPPQASILKQAVEQGDVAIVRAIMSVDRYSGIEKDSLLSLAVERDNIEVFKALLSTDGLDRDFKAHSKLDCLTVAASMAHAGFIDLILTFLKTKEMLDIFMPNIHQALSMIGTGKISPKKASMHTKMVAESIYVIVKRCPTVNPNTLVLSKPPIIWAIEQGHFDLLQILIDNTKVDLNIVCLNRTPLMRSIEVQNLKATVMLLVDKLRPRLDINCRVEDGVTALYIACQAKSKAALVFLGHPAFDPSKHNCTACLCLAIRNRNAQLVEALLTFPQIDVSVVPPIGDLTWSPPLLQAIEIGDAKLAVRMVNHRSFHKDKSLVMSAIHMACVKDMVPVLSELLQQCDNNPNIQCYGQSLLMTAISASSVGAVEYILSHKGFNPSENDISECFEQALKNTKPNHDRIVGVLLDSGFVDINCVFADGETALTCGYITEGVIDKILKRPGIDLNVCNVNGKDAIAANVQRVPVVQKILADPRWEINRKRGPCENTALICLVYHLEAPDKTLELLLSMSEIDLNIQNAEGLTALMVAVLLGKWAIAKRLLSTGSCALDIRDNAGRSLMEILDMSAHNGLLTQETHAPTEVQEPPTPDKLATLFEQFAQEQAQREQRYLSESRIDPAAFGLTPIRRAPFIPPFLPR